MELKPMLCTQCGAPLKDGHCSYCGVDYVPYGADFADGHPSQSGLLPMTNEEFTKYKRDTEKRNFEAEEIDALSRDSYTGDKLTIEEIRKAVRSLKEAKARMFNNISDGSARKPHFICVCSPDAIEEFQRDVLWQDVKRYADVEPTYTGEIGRLYGVVFIERAEVTGFRIISNQEQEGEPHAN